MMTRSVRTYPRTMLILGLGVLLSGLAGGSALAADTDAVAGKTPEQVWNEIGTFQYLHAIKLSKQQALAAAEAIAPVAKLAAEIEARDAAPGVLAALAVVRAAALAGKPITEEMYKQVTTAKAKAAAEWSDETKPTVWAAAAEVAEKLVAGLSKEQQLALIRYEAAQHAETLVDGAAGQAEADAEAWNQWLSDALQDATNADEGLSEDARQKLSAFFTKVHGLAPEALDAQRSGLIGELASLLVVPAGDEGLAKLAVEQLSDAIVNNPALRPCLFEYAATVAG